MDTKKLQTENYMMKKVKIIQEQSADENKY